MVNVFDIADGQIKVFPNPVNDLLWIQSDFELDRCIVVNTLGKEVDQIQLQQNNITYNVSDWQDGLYILMVMVDDDVYRTTFIKQ